MLAVIDGPVWIIIVPVSLLIPGLEWPVLATVPPVSAVGTGDADALAGGVLSPGDDHRLPDDHQ